MESGNFDLTIVVKETQHISEEYASDLPIEVRRE
jgi:hypothetical protein